MFFNIFIINQLVPTTTRQQNTFYVWMADVYTCVCVRVCGYLSYWGGGLMVLMYTCVCVCVRACVRVCWYLSYCGGGLMVPARGSAAPSTAERAPGERGPARSRARLLLVSYTKSRHDASLDSRF